MGNNGQIENNFIKSTENFKLNVKNFSNKCSPQNFYESCKDHKINDKKKNSKKRIDSFESRVVYVWEKKPIIQWNIDDVKEWMKVIGFESVNELFYKEVDSGKNLYLLENESDIFNEFKDEKKLFIFFVYLHYLKHCVRSSACFSFRFHFVLQKMIRVGDVQRDWGYKELAVMCTLLSSKASIKKHFLDSKEKGKSNNVKVKLIITETTFSKAKQLLRKIISPIISKIPTLKQDFGLFHSALLIGPFYLEWTDSELIIPKQIKSGSAYLTIDVDPITTKTDQDFETVKDILSEIIEKWNTEYKYSSIPNEKVKKGNCQTFINDICSALGLQMKVGGALKEFVDVLNKKGECKLHFKPPKSFIHDFKINEYKNVKKYKQKDGSYKIIFLTHQELDDFCYYCYETNIEGYLKYPEEYTLLKSFDRAFWLRHLKNQSDKLYQPAPKKKNRSFGTMERYHTGCPFLDPRDTCSFVG